MERIIARDIEKTFKIGQRYVGGLGRLVSLFSGKEPRKSIKVLKGVSLSAEAGEIVGMVGKNGSGKSTLLRILAGIYKQDCGTVRTRGAMVPIIGLGFGFIDRLSMRDNIFLAGALFGLSRDTIKERFDDIVGFAELSDFIETKLFQFSIGMRHRLAFSIAIHCDPDILLLDEVFEVGDVNFRRRSSGKIKELAAKGTTVILVSHELWMIKKHCKRTIWLYDGKVRMDGETSRVLKGYQASVDEADVRKGAS